MNKTATGVLGVMLGLFAVTGWASYTGLGAPRPEKKPVSIREDSARQGKAARGHYRTRYFFIGGGLHGGK